MYCFFKIDVPNSLLQPFDTSGLLSGLPGGITRNFYTFNLQDYIAWQSSPAGFAARDAALGLPPGSSQTFYNSQPGGFLGTRQPDSYAVNEKTAALYGDSTMTGKWSSVGWTLNLGARLVWTKTKAVGNQQKLVQIVSADPNPTQYGTVFDTSGTGFQSATNDYLKLLPNLNLTLNWTDQLLTRFGVSETMSRPELKDLSPRLSYADLRPGALNASGGNINLKPYTSTNIDLSLEYYFSGINYVTLAAFRKEVQDFIVTDTQTEIVPVSINTQNTDPLINKTNGTATFSVQRPRNADTATVEGIEIGAQYAFDFGLGISANATFLRSNAQISSNSSISTLFAIPGLGNSKNVQVFYEHGPIEARVSWSRRDQFLETLVNPKAGVEPVFTDKFDQVDSRIAYHINANYAVFAEGTNVLGEKLYKHGRYENQFILSDDMGARYALGFRANF
jgi:TonB-dependent receptor